jgi:hypothetical protein
MFHRIIKLIREFYIHILELHFIHFVHAILDFINEFIKHIQL